MTDPCYVYVYISISCCVCGVYDASRKKLRLKTKRQIQYGSNPSRTFPHQTNIHGPFQGVGCNVLYMIIARDFVENHNMQ